MGQRIEVGPRGLGERGLGGQARRTWSRWTGTSNIGQANHPVPLRRDRTGTFVRVDRHPEVGCQASDRHRPLDRQLVLPMLDRHLGRWTGTPEIGQAPRPLDRHLGRGPSTQNGPRPSPHPTRPKSFKNGTLRVDPPPRSRCTETGQANCSASDARRWTGNSWHLDRQLVALRRTDRPVAQVPSATLDRHFQDRTGTSQVPSATLDRHFRDWTGQSPHRSASRRRRDMTLCRPERSPAPVNARLTTHHSLRPPRTRHRARR